MPSSLLLRGTKLKIHARSVLPMTDSQREFPRQRSRPAAFPQCGGVHADSGPAQVVDRYVQAPPVPRVTVLPVVFCTPGHASPGFLPCSQVKWYLTCIREIGRA